MSQWTDAEDDSGEILGVSLGLLVTTSPWDAGNISPLYPSHSHMIEKHSHACLLPCTLWKFSVSGLLPLQYSGDGCWKLGCGNTWRLDSPGLAGKGLCCLPAWKFPCCVSPASSHRVIATNSFHKTPSAVTLFWCFYSWRNMGIVGWRYTDLGFDRMSISDFVVYRP